MAFLIDLIQKNNYRFLHLGLLIISILALAIAYFIEYVLHYAPCPLCVYERFPYLALIKISLTTLIIKKLSKYTIVLVLLTLICACILATYHTGIERDIFQPSAICSSMIPIPKNLSIQHIKEMLYNQPITSCTKPAFKIFGLSMAEYNLLLNLALLSGVIITYFYPRQNKEQN